LPRAAAFPPEIDFRAQSGKIAVAMDIDAIVREKNIRFLDLKYSDLPGRLRHVTLPIERLEQALRRGVGFDGSSVSGFREVEYGDMVLKPDLSSAFVAPSAKAPTLSCFADIRETGTDRDYDRDPRAILKRAAEALRQAAGADAVMVQP
jgi:glutamine synthetase